jgi:hypothetical protein
MQAHIAVNGQTEPLKSPLEQRREHEYHARHATEAMRIVHELNAAGKQLRPADIRRCEEYATEVLRHKKFSPWLLVYTAVAGSFKEGWIPDNFYGARVIPIIQGRHGRVSSLKSLSRALLDSSLFPDLGSQINGTLLDIEYGPLAFEDAQVQFFRSDERIIFKADASGRGKGIHFLDQRSFDRRTVARLGNGVFQRHVSQHPLLARFSEASVATIRLTTVVEDTGEISPRAANLRLGTGSDTHVRSQSQVHVPVDTATGALEETGLLANWRECSVHPTSGEPFAGKKIPGFDRCLHAVVSLHRSIPFVRCIGWDLTVDCAEEIQVLEWNGFHNGIKFSEATQGPCFRGLGWERFA